jgi:hypothetical protein
MLPSIKLTYEQYSLHANMQVLKEFAECNSELQFHLIVRILEAIYRLTHQKRTPSKYKVYHQPIRYEIL